VAYAAARLAGEPRAPSSALAYLHPLRARARVREGGREATPQAHLDVVDLVPGYDAAPAKYGNTLPLVAVEDPAWEKL
jgi:hypothetical protein